MEDFQAWQKYPHLRLWFNKLYLAELLGYDCGPGGVPPTTSNYYCVRPIYNLAGMGVGARKQWINAGDTTGVEPGYFWCEWFDGDQYSITYKSEDLYGYSQKSCFKAERNIDQLFRFKSWKRSNKQIPMPFRIEDKLMFSGSDIVNIEMIEDKVIELHFRDTPDPDYEELIPIWSDEQQMVDIYSKMDYSYIEAPDNSKRIPSSLSLGLYGEIRS